MKHKNYLAVSTFCVTIAIIFFFFIYGYLRPKLVTVEWAAPLLSQIATVGFYVSIFHFSIWFYSRFLEDTINSHEAIAGEWFYKLIINPKDGYEDNYRIGKCYIEKDSPTTIKISGVHFNPKIRKFTSHFVSEFVEINEDNIHVMYYAIGVTSGLDATKGMFFLKSVGNPPNTIHGFWSDVIPSRNSGSITLLRVNRETEQILEELGYPKDSSKGKMVFSDELKFNIEQSLKESPGKTIGRVDPN